ncbi:MAG: hypothetical protein M9954_06375 [Cyclobacteriaceae bacterium]|nr:hypothetical protein [Cyclobacteriaceae bacterium]MCB0500857.1 hypothetical protein [Cyclobacteriaceae bacterium]MCB9238438.1 hypothetical protein [Flammeovirgaceae bacterium]MCO5271267.1 hypothetical protein [Cyclobacteriaceae bacterium]MCW5903869.1 hypothetical protein [Cyclobacteriaceae bacterium]
MSSQSKYEDDLASIRNMMDRTSKFMSLSGLSGILSGIYALIGAGIAYFLLPVPLSYPGHNGAAMPPGNVLFQLAAVAFLVLLATIATTIWFSARKAGKAGTRVWDTSSKTLLAHLGVPVVSGGIFIVALLAYGHYGMVAPACLVFYGLGLVNASPNLYDEVRYLGYSEIVLGLMAAAVPGLGLLFWALGFGALHILYGTLMFRKYDR